MADLLPVASALERVLERISALPSEIIPTPNGLARALSHDVIAPADVPAFANASMDGYAVRSADVAPASLDAPIHLTVPMDLPAGRPPVGVLEPGQAARIMTGAPMPLGADAVVRVEDTDDAWSHEDEAALPDRVAIFHAVREGRNVRHPGEDMRRGQLVLARGTVLRPQEIGVLIALGIAEIEVYRQPRVAILAAGDELVDLGTPLQPGYIYNSNSYVLAGLVEEQGGVPIRLPIARDTTDDVRRAFTAALEYAPDLIVSSAGVSVGTRDVVRSVVDELGQIELWRVNLRPGKPLAFGHVRGVPFFGLPGNPVSAMVTFLVFVRPALRKQVGLDPLERVTTSAVVAEPLRSDGRESYLRVRLSEDGGELVARTTGTQSSGALLSMVVADGLLIVPAGVTEVEAGSRLPVWLLGDRLP